MVINPDTVDIIRDLINSMSFKIVVSSIVSNQDGTFSLITCNTSHLTTNTAKIEFSGVEYRVILVIQNESIQIKKELTGDPDPSGTEILLDSPFFIHGTIISTKNELDKKVDPSTKYPLIYLYEVYKERIIVDPTQAVGLESRVRLFFMDQTDPQNYTNEDQYVKVVRPMRSLTNDFIKSLGKNSKKINKLTENYELTPWVNFGKFTGEKGNVKKLFSDNISGYELSITIPIKRDYLEKLECQSCK